MKFGSVLIACEESGVVRRAMRDAGVDAWSCDTLPARDGSPFHFQCDVRELLNLGMWRGIIAFPPCTYLASSGLHWNKRMLGRAEKTEEALRFVTDILNAPAKFKALENPVGCISTRVVKDGDRYSVLGKSDSRAAIKPQYIQPYEHGDDASKRTGIYLHNLPPLKIDPARRIPGRVVVYKGKAVERWSNQTDSGQNRLGPSDERAMLRSETFPGIAESMVRAWAEILKAPKHLPM
jgi:hypothetical protein